MAMERKCFVPKCTLSTKNAPNAIFVTVPICGRRKKWFEAVGFKENHTGKGVVCCEHHFNFEEDAENWMFFKFAGQNLRIKKNVVPHLNIEDASSIDPNSSQLSPSDRKRKRDVLRSNAKKSPKGSNFLLAGLEKTPKTFTVIVPNYVIYHSISPQNNPESNEETKSRFYTTMGIPPNIYKLVHKLSELARVPDRDILITLKKISANGSFATLAKDFDLSSEDDVRRLFTSTVPRLANVMQQFIYWPTTTDLAKLLPVPFTRSSCCRNVQSIIDFLEIEIETPSDPPVKQELTWSEYKQKNTIKYMVSCTPNGFVNFVSNRYGGLSSDTQILEDSDYLEVIPCNVDVMTDRGFEQRVSVLLETKGCNLIGPQSVSAQFGYQIREKSVDFLRMSVERLVVRRLRGFSILKEDSCIDSDLLYLLDYIVIIACAIINTQGTLIKQ